MRGDGDDAHVALVVPPALVVRADGHQAGVLTARATVGLQRHRVEAGHLRQLRRQVLRAPKHHPQSQSQSHRVEGSHLRQLRCQVLRTFAITITIRDAANTVTMTTATTSTVALTTSAMPAYNSQTTRRLPACSFIWHVTSGRLRELTAGDTEPADMTTCLDCAGPVRTVVSCKRGAP